MSHRNPLAAFVFASVAFSSLALVGRVMGASPTTCTTDSECPRGLTCQPWAVSAGNTPACAPDSPNCSVSTDNPPTAGGAGGVTGSSGSSGAGAVTGTDVGAGNVSGTTPPTTTVISRCAPGPCQTDSDCGADMVCHTESYSECSGGSASAPCQDGTKCAPPVSTEPTCTTKTNSFCAFHWQLPCNADAECGAGFTCQPQIMGTCSGGGAATAPSGSTGVGGSGGAAASEPDRPTSSPPDDCTTTMTFPGSCQPVATICNVDADCPGNWVCQDTMTAPSRGTASGAGAASGSGDGASGTDPGAEPMATDIAPTGGVGGGTTASSRMCISPFIPPTMASDKGTGGRLGGGEGTATPTSGSNPPSGTSGSGGTTALPGNDGANGPAHAGDSAGAPSDAGGCSVSGSGGSSQVGTGLVMLAFLGLGFGLVTRRRRR